MKSLRNLIPKKFRTKLAESRKYAKMGGTVKEFGGGIRKRSKTNKKKRRKNSKKSKRRYRRTKRKGG
tara:strand:- start:2520 stop:2720 length:201 start_codon:yes stop_codon:yes gene_type:complete